MATVLTPTTRPVSDWTVVALSVAALLVGVAGAFYTTFTIAGSPVTKTDHASAVIFLICLGFSCVIATIGMWGRWISAVPAVTSFLLIFGGLRSISNIEWGLYYAPVFGTQSLTYAWLLFGVIASAPFVIVGIRESNRVGSSFRKILCIGLAIAVPFVLLLSLAIPTQSEADAQFKTYKQQRARDHELSKQYAAEDRAYAAALEQSTSELKAAAYKMVLAISDSYDKNGNIPDTYVEPDGYEVTTYTVQNKAKVEFCIKPKDSSSYLGVIVDPTVSDGTMYWYTEPRGGSCEYTYDNMRQL